MQNSWKLGGQRVKEQMVRAQSPGASGILSHIRRPPVALEVPCGGHGVEPRWPSWDNQLQGETNSSTQLRISGAFRFGLQEAAVGEAHILPLRGVWEPCWLLRPCETARDSHRVWVQAKTTHWRVKCTGAMPGSPRAPPTEPHGPVRGHCPMRSSHALGWPCCVLFGTPGHKGRALCRGASGLPGTLQSSLNRNLVTLLHPSRVRLGTTTPILSRHLGIVGQHRRGPPDCRGPAFISEGLAQSLAWSFLFSSLRGAFLFFYCLFPWDFLLGQGRVALMLPPDD